MRAQSVKAQIAGAIIAVTAIYVGNCSCAADTVPVSSVKWMGLIGGSGAKAHQEAIYSLMAQGLFQRDIVSNTNEVLANWLKHHPSAYLTVVARYGPVSDYKNSPNLIYVWVEQDDDNLNLELIRHGCISAQSQLIRDDQKLAVERSAYEAFYEKALQAQNQAKNKRIGIWTD